MSQLGTYIGVDLGGTQMRAARISEGIIVEQYATSTPRDAKDQQETVDALIAVIAAVMNRQVEAVGIGVPSVVDRRRGIVYNVTNIPHWDEVYLKDMLTDHFNKPVYIDNDANCFALGERYFGEGRTFENFVGITLGTGLGGGIVQQGRLLSDANCGSGEYGEMPYLEHNIEYYCSGSYFMNVWGINGLEMYQRAQKGDAQALEAYRQLGTHLSVAVKMIVLSVDPQMIVFGGSVAEAYPFFEASMHEGLKVFAFPKSIEKLQIRYSSLENSGLYGAASLCY